MPTIEEKYEWLLKQLKIENVDYYEGAASVAFPKRSLYFGFDTSTATEFMFNNANTAAVDKAIEWVMQDQQAHPEFWYDVTLLSQTPFAYCVFSEDGQIPKLEMIKPKNVKALALYIEPISSSEVPEYVRNEIEVKILKEALSKIDYSKRSWAASISPIFKMIKAREQND